MGFEPLRILDPRRNFQLQGLTGRAPELCPTCFTANRACFAAPKS
jgi:hypothetical protein